MVFIKTYKNHKNIFKIIYTKKYIHRNIIDRASISWIKLTKFYHKDI